jgi:thioredoxin-like negative regulator of GroEL
VDIDQNIETAVRFSVLSIPTVMVFAGGRLEETVIGAHSRSHYERALERWLQPAASSP